MNTFNYTVSGRQFTVCELTEPNSSVTTDVMAVFEVSDEDLVDITMIGYAYGVSLMNERDINITALEIITDHIRKEKEEAK